MDSIDADMSGPGEASLRHLEKAARIDTDLLDLSDMTLLRLEKVARILDISRAYAYRLAFTGELPAVHIGSSVRVRARDLQRFIEELKA